MILHTEKIFFVRSGGTHAQIIMAAIARFISTAPNSIYDEAPNDYAEFQVSGV